MIRLLEISKYFEGGRRHGHVPMVGNVSRLEVHLKSNVMLPRLLAGGARIHVDFHADRHFYDFWGFPSHFGSLLFQLFNRTVSALADKLVRNEKFASEIFFKPVLMTFGLCCTAKGAHVFVQQDVQTKDG
jgi:hypothetical protein